MNYLKKFYKVFFIFIIFIFIIRTNVNAGADLGAYYGDESIKTPNIKVEKAITLETKHNNQGIPILMYHSIGYEKGNDLRVPKEKFAQQMKYLYNNGYTTLNLRQVYDFFQYDTPIPKKSVVLTFDDGYIDNYLYAYPVLKKYNFNATVFIVTSWVNKDKAYMNSAQLKEIDKNGFQVESHTAYHDELVTLSKQKQVNTFQKSKKFLENTLNRKIDYIAYPFGKFNKNSIDALKETKYKMALTIKGSWARKKSGIYSVHRMRITDTDTIKSFKNKIGN